MDHRKWWGRLRIVILGVGVAAVVLLVHQVGTDSVLASLRRLGWAGPALLGFSAAWKVLNALSWRVAISGRRRLPRFRRLLAASLAGDVLNNVLPTASLGGEFAKPYLLRKELPAPLGIAGVAANKTVEVGVGLVAAGIAAALSVTRIGLPDPVRIGLAIVLLGGVSAVGVVMLAQRSGPAGRLLGVLSRIGYRGGGRFEGAASVDRELAAFYRAREPRIWICAALRATSLLLGGLETWCIGMLMGAEWPFLDAFVFFALTMLLDAALFFVPGGIGTSEAGSTTLFVALGLDPSMGLALALARRVRKLFWVSVGTAVLFRIWPGGRVTDSTTDAGRAIPAGALEGAIS